MQIYPRGQSLPAILVLGDAGTTTCGLDSLCESAGILIDRARTREEAFAAFLKRGGHDALVCVGELPRELHDVPATLREVDRELPLLTVPVGGSLGEVGDEISRLAQ
jgi:hypothetical protein